MTFSQEALSAAIEHAREEWPGESVGYISRAGRYVALTNIHARPRDAFIISSRDMLAVLAHGIALVHSHPVGPAYPSQSDMQAQSAMLLPWAIVAFDPSEEDGSGHVAIVCWGEDGCEEGQVPETSG